jgi:hypothetical protein
MPSLIKNQTAQTCVALGVALTWMASIAAPNARADSAVERRPKPSVQISVYNDVGLKRGTLRLAEENAAAIFRRAGIETEWKNCPGEEISPQSAVELQPPCGQAAYPSKLVLRIIRHPRGLVPDVFGVAYLSQDGQGAYCNVFVEPMEELQRMYPVSLDAILGHVAAHEIAHLLLGRNSHSPTGLMRAHWNSRTIDDLRRGILDFDSTQSSVMADRIEFARDTTGITAALVTLADLPPATFSPIPPQCPNSH